MTVLSTNYERVDTLTHISDQIYPILEMHNGSETRARQILRVGIASIAIALRDGETPEYTGERFNRHLAHELRDVDYGAYEPYRTQAEALPAITIPQELADLINDYADTLRSTELADLSQEPDAIHALHLSALAVPYARAHYSQLKSGLVGVYAPTHDLPEAISGDIQTFDITDQKRKLKDKKTHHAINTLWSRYGKHWPEFIELIEAYEGIVNAEAAFVKTLDKNDPGYTHFRNSAHALKTRHGIRSAEHFYTRVNENTLRTLSYASQFALILEDKDVLNERIAAHFAEKEKSSPLGVTRI